MNINKLFGKRVKEARLKINMSQEKLANLADIDRTYLPSIEKGERNVSLLIADKIAKALKINLDQLIK